MQKLGTQKTFVAEIMNAEDPLESVQVCPIFLLAVNIIAMFLFI